MSSGIYWGEIACLPAPFELVMTTGFEPPVATVAVHRDQFVTFLQRFPNGPFTGLAPGEPPLPKLASLLNQSKPSRFVQAESLPLRAHLVVEETRLDFRFPGVRIADMFLLAARALERAGDHEVLELTLTGVQHFWPTHGVLLRDYNVPRGIAADGTPLYEQRSLRAGTKPHKVREILQDCLDALPGGGTVVRFPDQLEQALEVRAQGAAPLDVLRGICDRLELAYARTLEGDAAFYLPGDGLVGEGFGVNGAPKRLHVMQTGKGVWEKHVLPSSTFSQRVATDAPDEIAIVCPPPVYSVQVDHCVPWVRLETPDPDGGPPKVVELEVTEKFFERLGVVPLDGLAQGQFGSGTEAWRVYKLPLVDGPLSEGSRSKYGAVPLHLVEPLKAELFVRYRLPVEHAHLAPFLKRAELASDGSRRSVIVEAFGYKALTVDVTKDEAEARGIAPDSRTTAELVLGDLEARLAAVRVEIKKRSEVVAKDFVDAYNELVKAIPSLRETADTWIRGQRPPALPETVETRDLARKLANGGNRLALELLGLTSDVDPSQAELSELVRLESDLKGRRTAALAAARPEQAIRERLQQLVSAFTAKAQTVGIDLALAEEIRTVEEELEAALAARNLKTQRPVREPRHMNLPRRPVPHHIDGEWIVLEEPSVWLQDSTVPFVVATFAVPMPVRITFGSWCLPKPSNAQLALPAGAVSHNAILSRVVAEMAKRPELAGFLVDLGGFQPLRPEGGPLVLTFTRAELTSGKAKVKYPFRLDATQDPTMQVRFELPTSVDGSGADNFAEVLERGTRRARALMRPQMRESGVLVVAGPRPVNCSSRVTGVRWSAGESGCVDTELSFESEAEPFPGFESTPPDRTQGPIVAGFDLQNPEDAA